MIWEKFTEFKFAKRLHSTFYVLRFRKNGQIMILASLALGGALLGIAGLAGLLMISQVRQTTDLQNSTKAIMAADSGIEWGLYQFFHPSGPPIATNPNCPDNCDPNGGKVLGPYDNGAIVTVNCYGLTVDFSQNPPQTTEQEQPNCSNASSVEAVAFSNGANRSFRAFFQIFK